MNELQAYEFDASASTALMHLKMIVLAAKGDYSPKAGELEKREAAVVSFMLTGQCVAGESERSLAAKVNEVVSSHYSEVNTAAPNAA